MRLRRVGPFFFKAFDMDKPNYYGILPAVVRYAKIADRAKVLYTEITALANKYGYCTASNNYFADLYECTPQAISKHIGALEAAGFVQSVLTYEGKQVTERRIYPVAMLAKAEEAANRYQPTVDRVSTDSLEGINPQLIGYQPQVEVNNTSINTTSKNINNTHTGEIEKLDLESEKYTINAAARAASTLREFLKANEQYLPAGISAQDLDRAITGYFTKQQASGKFYDLKPPTKGKIFTWVGKHLAGVQKWHSVAKNIDQRQPPRPAATQQATYTAPRQQGQAVIGANKDLL